MEPSTLTIEFIFYQISLSKKSTRKTKIIGKTRIQSFFTFPQYSHASFFELPRGRLLSVVVGVGITDWPGSCVGVIVGKTGYPNWLGSPGMNGDRIPTNKG